MDSKKKIFLTMRISVFEINPNQDKGLDIYQIALNQAVNQKFKKEPQHSEKDSFESDDEEELDGGQIKENMDHLYQALQEKQQNDIEDMIGLERDDTAYQKFKREEQQEKLKEFKIK